MPLTGLLIAFLYPNVEILKLEMTKKPTSALYTVHTVAKVQVVAYNNDIHGFSGSVCCFRVV